MLRVFVLLLVLTAAFAAPAQAGTQAKAPDKVYIGSYINDIQAIDLRTHSYRLDLYVWFRWKNPDLDPARSVEFMNAYNPSDHVRTAIYEKPEKMPDGSFYTVIRQQGEFSVKFPLHRYPFDRQLLAVDIEDSVYETDDLEYVLDDVSAQPVALNEGIHLPGFNIGKAFAELGAYPYATTFGDISQKEAMSYSRVSIKIPVGRPWLTTGIKLFLPILLVLFCAAMVFFIYPAYIEGRLGVAITALLTLVALQLTASTALPDVDYLMMIDKVYVLSYLFILGTLLQVVRHSGLVSARKYEDVMHSDRRAVFFLGFLCAAAAVIVGMG